MPKIKVISRTEKSMGRDTKDQMMKIRRSTNQLIHPFQKVKYDSKILSMTKSLLQIKYRKQFLDFYLILEFIG